ncbi:7170_t:CDS:1, partial [Scutellospora calospora]
KTLGIIQEYKKFRLKLVWALVNFANDTSKVKLRNSIEKKKESKRIKVTKHFELTNQRLEPGDHFVEWKKTEKFASDISS